MGSRAVRSGELDRLLSVRAQALDVPERVVVELIVLRALRAVLGVAADLDAHGERSHELVVVDFVVLGPGRKPHNLALSLLGMAAVHEAAERHPVERSRQDDRILAAALEEEALQLDVAAFDLELRGSREDDRVGALGPEHDLSVGAALEGRRQRGP
jgi:hypothetical protein